MGGNFSWLVVGLGNPGPKYAGTRHNFGFMVVDALLNRLDKQGRRATASVSGLKGRCDLWRCHAPELSVDDWLAAKPLTYMNLSGLAVAAICRHFYLRPAQVLVIHDELDLPFGRIRLKSGGGLAGHKGLVSIAEHLGSTEFQRLRLGISQVARDEVVDYVLSRFSPDDQTVMGQIVNTAAEAVETVIATGLEAAMNTFNSVNIQPEKKPPPA